MISVSKMRIMKSLALSLIQAEINDFSGRKSICCREVHGTAHSNRLRLLIFRIQYPRAFCFVILRKIAVSSKLCQSQDICRDI